MTNPLEPIDIPGRAGPVRLAILGGVHGDEPEGVLAVRLLVERLAATDIKGSVRLLSVTHASAWSSGTRSSPLDGKNLARCFPGDPEGSETERLARVVTDKVIAPATFLVDLHSAGRDFTMPFFAGAIADASPHGQAAAAAALAFGAPLVWLHRSANPGRSITAAHDLGIPAVYVEGGGGGTVGADLVEAYVEGTLRVMMHLGMLEEGSIPPAATGQRVIADGDGNIDAGTRSPASGWCISRAKAGDLVQQGELLASIHEESTGTRSEVRTEHAGIVALARHGARVEQDELLYLVAPPPRTLEKISAVTE